MWNFIGIGLLLLMTEERLYVLFTHNTNSGRHFGERLLMSLLRWNLRMPKGNLFSRCRRRRSRQRLVLRVFRRNLI